MSPYLRLCIDIGFSKKQVQKTRQAPVHPSMKQRIESKILTGESNLQGITPEFAIIEKEARENFLCLFCFGAF
jgi:hypothetical protein